MINISDVMETNAMIHEEIDRMLKQYEENLKMQGLTLKQFYQFTNSDEQALKDQMHGEAEKRVLYRLMLEEIAKAEKIEIDDTEANKEAEKLAEKYQMKKEEFKTKPLMCKNISKVLYVISIFYL